MTHWQYAGLEPLFDRWVTEDSPSDELRWSMLEWLLAVQEDPYRAGTAAVPGSILDTRIAPLPSFPRLCLFYAVDTGTRTLTALLLETT